MTSAAPAGSPDPSSTGVPAESDVLCESCGYTLNGLPADGRCPECGADVAASTVDAGRVLPAWEADGKFWATTGRVVFRPTDFFRHLRTRVDSGHAKAAGRFAFWHWLIAAFLAASASFVHYFMAPGGTLFNPPTPWWKLPVSLFYWIAFATPVGLGVVLAVTLLAAWLTTWEASWRGYRLPKAVVLRGLHYHAAHLPPVALSFLITTAGYRLLLGGGVLDFATSVVPYLIVLSVVVVVGLVYLFLTYWIAMKNMLYANV